MTEQANIRPEQQYSPDPSVLERWAARYLQSQNDLDEFTLRERRPEEVRALNKTCRQVVAWAAIAGILSGGIIGGIEIFIRQGMLDGMEDMDWSEQLPYWAGFTVVAGLVSGIEILFLYWTALRGVARTCRLAGTPFKASPYAQLMVRGQSRIALEFPSPRNRIYGIDPFAYMQNWKLTLRALLYRVKVGVSSFIIRILLRRILGRLALRSFIPLVTGPLYAVWNAAILWRIMREARENALGPFATETLIEWINDERERLSPECRKALMQATGELLMRNQSAHPNTVYLLSRLVEIFDSAGHNIEVDWPRQQRKIEELDTHEQRLLLNTLTGASLMCGKMKRDKWRFLEQLYASCGRASPHPKTLGRLRDKLLDGQQLTADDFASVVE